MLRVELDAISSLTVTTGAVSPQLPGGAAVRDHEPTLPVLLLRTARVVLVSGRVRRAGRLATCQHQ